MSDRRIVNAKLKGPVPEKLRQKAREALDGGEPPVVVIQGFGGWVRNPTRFDGQALRSLAKTFPGRPLLGRRHDADGGLLDMPAPPPPREGVVEAASVGADGTLDLETTITGMDALQDLADGVIPQYSIQWQRTQSTTMSCSACGAVWSNGDDCDHWPGDVVTVERAKGSPARERVDLVWGREVEAAEITRLYTPGATGTGIKGFQLDDAAQDAASLCALKASVIRRAGGSIMWDQTKAEEARTDQSDLEVAELKAERDALQAERDALTSKLTEARAAEAKALRSRAKDLVLSGLRSGKLFKLRADEGEGSPFEDEISLALEIGIDRYEAHLSRIPGQDSLRGVDRLPALPEPPKVDEDDTRTDAQKADEFTGKVVRLQRENPGLSAEEIWQRAAEEGRR